MYMYVIYVYINLYYLPVLKIHMSFECHLLLVNIWFLWFPYVVLTLAGPSSRYRWRPPCHCLNICAIYQALMKHAYPPTLKNNIFSEMTWRPGLSVDPGALWVHRAHWDAGLANPLHRAHHLFPLPPAASSLRNTQIWTWKHPRPTLPTPPANSCSLVTLEPGLCVTAQRPSAGQTWAVALCRPWSRLRAVWDSKFWDPVVLSMVRGGRLQACPQNTMLLRAAPKDW